MSASVVLLCFLCTEIKQDVQEKRAMVAIPIHYPIRGIDEVVMRHSRVAVDGLYFDHGGDRIPSDSPISDPCGAISILRATLPSTVQSASFNPISKIKMERLMFTNRDGTDNRTTCRVVFRACQRTNFCFDCYGGV